MIDYGVGNLGAIENIISYLGSEVRISSNPDDIRVATRLVLPGIGHFAKALNALETSGLRPVVEDLVMGNKTPILGICVGMQMLLEHGSEGDVPGLGWIGGRVVGFDTNRFESPRLQVPHMGWSDLEVVRPGGLLTGLEDEARFYFAHSFHAEGVAPGNVLARVHYGYDFPVAIAKDNIFGVQFHPEKSHKFGMSLFRNFLKL